MAETRQHLEVMIAEALYDTWGPQQKIILDELTRNKYTLLQLQAHRQAQKQRSVYGFDIDWNAETMRMAIDLQPVFDQVLEEGYREVAALYADTNIIVDWDVYNTRAAEYSTKYGYDLITQINDSTREQIGKAVRVWIENDEDFPVLRERIRRLVPDNPYPFIRDRAKLIAATEATRVFAEAERADLQASGLRTMRWRNAEDELVCEICGPLGAADGGEGAVGDVATGLWIHPVIGEKVGMPAHPGCRCWAAPNTEEMEANAAKPFRGKKPIQPDPGMVQPQPPGIPPPPLPVGPMGKPVSESLRRPKSGKYAPRIESTLEAIDGVHGDGELHELPVKNRKKKGGEYGLYRHSQYPEPRGVEIRMNTNYAGELDDHYELTLAHEVGHFIDHMGLGETTAGATPTSYAKHKWGTSRPELTEWWAAVEKSDASKQMMDMMLNPNKYAVTKTYTDWQGNDRSYTYAPDQSFLKYTSSQKEFFARSYSQYIATRSGNAAMLEQVAYIRNEGMYGARQWQDDDFEPIAQAFDNLFRSLGWLQ